MRLKSLLAVRWLWPEMRIRAGALKYHRQSERDDAGWINGKCEWLFDMDRAYIGLRLQGVHHIAYRRKVVATFVYAWITAL